MGSATRERVRRHKREPQPRARLRAREGSVTTTFVWDGSDYLAANRSGADDGLYIVLEGEVVGDDVGGTLRDFLTDPLGSVRGTFNASNVLSNQVSYWPYGETIGAPRSEVAPLNVKRVHRLWKEEKLGRLKRYRKKRTGNSVPVAADAPNQVWSLDFVHDACLNGTKLKVLAIVDEFTRECLALETHTSFKSLRVQQVLSKLFEGRAAPAFLRSDNGSEFISRSLAVFLSSSGSGSHFIKPGSPWQNAYVESFNSTLRRDLLDVEVFYNLADAQVKLSLYRRFYNEQRPHSSLGYRPPAVAHALRLEKDSS